MGWCRSTSTKVQSYLVDAVAVDDAKAIAFSFRSFLGRSCKDARAKLAPLVAELNSQSQLPQGRVDKKSTIPRLSIIC
jgi:hypothetical protein